MNKEKECKPVDEGVEKDKDKESPRTEVIKASVSEALGTLLFPITREIAKLEELAIDKFKSSLKVRRKEIYYSKTEELIKEFDSTLDDDFRAVNMTLKLNDLFEEASEHELEHDELLSLWSSLILALKDSDPNYELMLEKVKSLTLAEAKFILEFEECAKIKKLDINPIMRALKLKFLQDDEDKQLQVLALELQQKGIVEQPFPFVRAFISLLLPTLFFLISAELLRSNFEVMGVNVSSANNVILMGVAGTLLGSLSLLFLKKPIRFTWIGGKIFKGAQIALQKYF